MGMYDTFRLDNIELPSLQKTDRLDEYQTKDLDCNLDYYRVTSDGRLVVQDNDFMGDGVRFNPVPHTGNIHLRGPQDLRLVFAGGRLQEVHVW